MPFKSLITIVATSLLAGQALAVSVHNWWNVPSDFGDIAELRSSIRVPQGSDPIKTYWMANGFGNGYMGMQHNSDTERRILFSIWDDGHGSKVEPIRHGKNVHVGTFGGEGTGGQSYLHHNWKAGDTVHFRVRANVSEAENYAEYTGYWGTDGKKWHLIASFRAENQPYWLEHPYGFLENYGSDQSKTREGYYGNFVMINSNGRRYTPKKFQFTNTDPSTEYREVWDQRLVKQHKEVYMRIDGPANQGAYPPKHH
ncbi:uncharacterized protein BYT42DRAFT_570640 [Radiomyces spectabilis]|uniref:uncharacterized protein n=1 Tax=Radiomyces spectabilis TaxID=64574 RepID=UPI00221F18DF|nr:uncharacterized protein BYT42DRAFT_570640 [Radiomyces spectabilis]KAI8377537.1 hypothetical protein BYT42DRAFT_570640 [Radiomyces spectabilis]